MTFGGKVHFHLNHTFSAEFVPLPINKDVEELGVAACYHASSSQRASYARVSKGSKAAHAQYDKLSRDDNEGLVSKTRILLHVVADVKVRSVNSFRSCSTGCLLQLPTISIPTKMQMAKTGTSRVCPSTVELLWAWSTMCRNSLLRPMATRILKSVIVCNCVC